MKVSPFAAVVRGWCVRHLGRWCALFLGAMVFFATLTMDDARGAETVKGAEVRSRNGGPKVTIGFQNRTGQPLMLYWLDHQGQRQQPAQLAPGAVASFTTWLYYPYLVTTADEKIRRIYFPDYPDRMVVLDKSFMQRSPQLLELADPRRDFREFRRAERRIFVEEELFEEHSELANRALERLVKCLERVDGILPKHVVARLREVNVFLMAGELGSRDGMDNGGYYWPRESSRFSERVDLRMNHSVMIFSAQNYVWLSDFWAVKVLLHEFGHAWHLTNWPEAEPGIIAAFERARQRGLYRNVEHRDGEMAANGGRGDGYAIQNHLEYFSELTCLYFWGLSYEPFSRERGAEYDPDGLAMIERYFGVDSTAGAASEMRADAAAQGP